MKKLRQIVALGGGMFSMEPDNGLLDKYILNLVPKEKPKICFFGTASNDGKEYRDLFYNFYKGMQCEPSHLEFARPPKDIEAFILDKDIIHVGGGHTSLIIETWKKFGVDKIMRKAWESGIILTGMSAGAICWFDDGMSNPSHGVLSRLPCLGLLDGSFCPHYDDRTELRSAYRELILKGKIEEGFGVEDGAAIHFAGSEPVRVVTSRPGASAYRVRKVRNRIIEEKMSSIYLGKESDVAQTADEKKQTEMLMAVDSFVEKINLHDVEGLTAMLTEDHIFLDSMGSVIKGKKELKSAWRTYFRFFPDYEISVLNTLITGDTIALFGFARGTFASEEPMENDEFHIPAAWRARVRDRQISEWQAIADNESVRRILDEHGRRVFIRSRSRLRKG